MHGTSIIFVHDAWFIYVWLTNSTLDLGHQLQLHCSVVCNVALKPIDSNQ